MPSATNTTDTPSCPSSFRIAIIGGGIGGLTCALSLAHHLPPAVQIDVYEQAPEYREIGAGIGINVSAARILHKLGLGAAANGISGERDGVHRCMRRWDNGEEIVTVDALYDEGEIKQLSVHRAEFLDVLYKAIEKRGAARMHTDKRAVKVEDSGAEVSITFADGSKGTANLVVAADGIHSAIRAQFAPDRPRYSGRIAYRGLLPLSAVSKDWPLPSYAVSWLAPNKHFLVFPISRNRTLNVVAFVTRPEDQLGELKESWTSSAPREELEREYEGWDHIVQRIISYMEPRPGKWRLNDRELLQRWTYLDGKVVFLGDAAHAMLPHQGSGAGHAIEDTYILGLSLRDYLAASSNFFSRCSSPASSPASSPSPVDAPSPIDSSLLSTYTSLYESVRLPRAQKAQLTSRQAGDVYEMQGPDFEGLASYDDCLPLVAAKLKDRMRWVWGGDLDGEYERVKKEKGISIAGVANNTDGGGSDGGNGLSEIVEMNVELKKSEKISAGAEEGRMDHIVGMTNSAVVRG